MVSALLYVYVVVCENHTLPLCFLLDLQPLPEDVPQNWQPRADPSQQHHRVPGLNCTWSQLRCTGKYQMGPERCFEKGSLNQSNLRYYRNVFLQTSLVLVR